MDQQKDDTKDQTEDKEVGGTKAEKNKPSSPKVVVMSSWWAKGASVQHNDCNNDDNDFFKV